MNPYSGAKEKVVIEFGKTYKDVITGFVGVATGKCDYITGCAQVLLAPCVTATGDRREPQWFDLDRCEDTGARQIELTTRASDGADMPAPVR